MSKSLQNQSKAETVVEILAYEIFAGKINGPESPEVESRRAELLRKTKDALRWDWLSAYMAALDVSKAKAATAK